MGIRYESYGNEEGYAPAKARAFDEAIIRYKVNHVKYSMGIDAKSKYFLEALSIFMGRNLQEYEKELVLRITSGEKLIIDSGRRELSLRERRILRIWRDYDGL